MTKYGVTHEQMQRFAAAEKERASAMEDIKNTVLENLDFKVGFLVEHKESGHRYRLIDIHPYIYGGEVVITMIGRRVWKTGRRAGKSAISETILSFDDVQRVNPDAD